jgi:hypothetical protein
VGQVQVADQEGINEFNAWSVELLIISNSLQYWCSPSLNPSVQALVTHIIMNAFKGTINLKPFHNGQ